MKFIATQPVRLAVACTLALPSLAVAAPSSNISGNTETLNPVVVTAARLEQSLLDTLPATTIISAQTIRDSGARDLPSLLRQQAGIDVVQAGGPGTLPNVFLRGASLNQIAVLIDGVRLDSLSSGLPALQTLAIENIERVEIARGNLSSLYGSGAIGGVIQIFTRRGRASEAAHFMPQLSAEAGEHRQNTLSAGISGGVGGLDVSVGAAHQATGGFSAVNAAQATSANPDDDRYTKRSGHVNAGYAIDASNQVRFMATTQRGRVDYDDASGFGTPTGIQYSDFETTTLALKSEHQVGKNIALNFALDQSDDRARDTSIDSFSYTSFVNTRTQHGEAGTTLSLGGVRVTSAYERTQTRLTSDTTFDKSRRDIDTVRVGAVGNFDVHEWQANVRYDDYSDFGKQTTSYLGYGLRLGPQWRLLAAASTGFRAPTFNDLYYPFGFGNPNLKPESSRNVEMGASWQGSIGRARATAFRMRYRDLILLDANFMPGNIGTATTKGLELMTAWQVAGFDFEANAMHLDATNDASHLELPRRAHTSFSASLAQQLGDWRWRLQTRAVGKRFDDTANTRTLDAYAVLDAAVTYHLCKDWTLRARVDNLTDKHYETVYSYNQPGRLFWLGFSYQPK
jgi:vitamin B12 transporter